jgi:hypothetical protein
VSQDPDHRRLPADASISRGVIGEMIADWAAFLAGERPQATVVPLLEPGQVDVADVPVADPEGFGIGKGLRLVASRLALRAVSILLN